MSDLNSDITEESKSAKRTHQNLNDEEIKEKNQTDKKKEIQE